MYAPHPQRALSAASSVALVGCMLALLVLGLDVRRTAESAVRLVSLQLTDPPPPPPNRPERPQTPHTHQPAPRHEASPRNLRNQATPVVAPPVQPLILPPPVIAAPLAGPGTAANTGASSLPGPGEGAGGIGNGNGGGGSGTGDGDGDGEPVVGPRQVGGKLSYRDLPEGVLGEGQEAAVAVIFAVNPNGTASECRAERPSGYPALDGLACRLIEQRFRFKPAKDREGKPVRSWVAETHTWVARAE